MGNGEGDHRDKKRVEYHFIVRVRPVERASAAAWDVSTIRNISKTGVLFYSSKYYDYNAGLEVRIKNPITSEEIICFGRMARCELLKKMKGVYSIAVEIAKVDRANKDIFDDTIKLFMDRSERPK